MEVSCRIKQSAGGKRGEILHGFERRGLVGTEDKRLFFRLLAKGGDIVRLARRGKADDAHRQSPFLNAIFNCEVFPAFLKNFCKTGHMLSLGISMYI